jgi:hypothetical protein
VFPGGCSAASVALLGNLSTAAAFWFEGPFGGNNIMAVPTARMPRAPAMISHKRGFRDAIVFAETAPTVTIEYTTLRSGTRRRNRMLCRS